MFIQYLDVQLSPPSLSLSLPLPPPPPPVEAAGGACLPCVVDIREEQQIQEAVDKAVEKFGGIDILVNNASAISLTNTLDTTMKRYSNYFHLRIIMQVLHVFFTGNKVLLHYREAFFDRDIHCHTA